MKLKLDEDGHAVVLDGKPVYVHDDGNELPFDAAATVATIGRLNGEAKSHRERAEQFASQLKGFEGIEDPAAAVKALQTLKNLDDKKLVDAGEVERVKNEAIKAVEDKYRPVAKKAETLEQRIYSLLVGNGFANSKFVAEKLSIPRDLVQARFGSQFKVEDDRIVAYDVSGNKLYSRAKPGELADFDEAMEMIVDQYPYKDDILKGTGASGTGAKGSAAGGGGSKTIPRAQFDAMSQYDRAARVKEGYKVVD